MTEAPQPNTPALYQKAYAQAYDEQWAEISGGEMTDQLLEIVEDLGIHGGRWLDLCCGGGRLLCEVKAKGFEPVGLDLSADLLKIARGLLPGAELVEACLPDCPVGGVFDVISCLGSSLSCLHSEADLKTSLQNAVALLKPGGVFLADLSTPFSMMTNDGEKIAFQGDLGDFIVSLSFDDDQSMLDWEVTGYCPGNEGRYDRYTELHQLKAWPLDSVGEMLEKAGLEVQLLDRDSLEALDEESWHALVLGRRVT